MSAWLALGVLPALAQSVASRNPTVPSASIAGENGPGALWVNPANLAYDPDARFGLFFAPGAQPTEVDWALTAGVRGLGAGVHHRPRVVGGAVVSDWSLDAAASVPLPQRLAIGSLLSGRINADAPDDVAYDVGISWRPLPWFGLGASAQQVAGSDPTEDSRPRTSAGFTLRPFDDRVQLGLDYGRWFGPSNAADALRLHTVSATARMRPAEALFVRLGAEADASAPSDWRLHRVGVGIEAYFNGWGGLLHQTFDGRTGAPSDLTGGRGTTLVAGTDEPGRSLVRAGHRVATLQLSGSIDDHPNSGWFGAQRTPDWLEVLNALEEASTDPSVEGVLVQLDGVRLSWAQAQELRSSIEHLEAQGKPVLAYLHGDPDTASYFVASAASRVAMHPAGSLWLVGLSVQLTQLRGLLDWVGVTPEFVRQAEYKSAVEQYTRHEPSLPSLEQTNALLDDFWGQVLADVARGRHTTPETVAGWIDGGPWSPGDAMADQLVDEVLYPDELPEALDQLHNRSVTGTALVGGTTAHSAWEQPLQIAVIYLDGAIVRGDGGWLGGEEVGADAIVRALEEAIEDPHIRAVVLRIDSPGGSSYASDEIWRATQRVRDAGKPLVVSMGGVAASGGYYVAAGADAIWAEPMTITGSIGVFSGHFSPDPLFERIGIQTTTLTRGRHAALLSTDPWDDARREEMQQLVDATYVQFKERVGSGRQLEPDAVEAAARGRVWSGQSALSRGLVDHLGGLREAIADARTRAGLDERPVATVTLDGGASAWLPLAAPALLSTHLPILEQMNAWLEPTGPAWTLATHPEERAWLMMPWTLDVAPR